MSAENKIRLLVADVDGTLVTNDKVLTQASVDVVRDLRRAGVTLAITSSRPPRGMRMLFAPLALEGPIAALNGGLYVNLDLSVIQCHALDPASAREALNVIVEHGLDVWIYTTDNWLVRDRGAPHVAREEWVLQFEAQTVVSFTDTQLAQAVKIVGVSDNPDQIAACGTLVQGAVGDRASVSSSQTYYLEVTSKLANKGIVVETLSKHFDIPLEHIATIGDMPVDVSMFHKSGFSIAMGNASDAVKAQANAVTDSNENEGFAKAIRKFILQSAGA